jgi:hypothetical protein
MFLLLKSFVWFSGLKRKMGVLRETSPTDMDSIPIPSTIPGLMLRVRFPSELASFSNENS